MKKTIAVVNPNSWDLEEINKRKNQYNFIFLTDSFQADSPSVFQIMKYFLFFNINTFIDDCVHRLEGKHVDGILGTDEYLSCTMAAIIAKRMNLPYTPPEAILRSQHKFVSRQIQKSVTPEHVPHFSEASKNHSFPIFIKPIRGSASFLAKRIQNERELKEHTQLGFGKRILYHFLMRPFVRLFRNHVSDSFPKDLFLTEAIVEGKQVTLEAFCENGNFNLIGIVDSIMYPGSLISFERFEYPSKLPNPVQLQMQEIAKKLAQAYGFTQGIFNVEFFYNEETGKITIIEFNPRMAFQFTDLYEKVDGFNSFDIQLALVTGTAFQISRKQNGVAASFVMRKFTDVLVVKTPSQSEIEDTQIRDPSCRIRIMAKEGQKLSHDFLQDTESYRYAIINLGAPNEAELCAKYEQLKSSLTFKFKETKT